jgi:uncharacterized coiled-coil DUF342 family protein
MPRSDADKEWLSVLHQVLRSEVKVDLQMLRSEGKADRSHSGELRGLDLQMESLSKRVDQLEPLQQENLKPTKENGGRSRARTADPLLVKQVL